MSPADTGIAQDEVTQRFRLAMRELAGGVCAVSVGADDDRGGLVATSVTSLSMDPPTLLVCVNRGSSAWPLFERHRCFGINVLAFHHLDMAHHFSGRTGAVGAARYGVGDWRADAPGAPLLHDAIVALDCEVEEILERHSHGIVIGRVRAVSALRPADALVYRRGAYAVHAA